jgi:ABC-2 type transport system ATP-binding protein
MAHTLADEDNTYEARVPGEPAPRGEGSCAIEARALRKVYKASGTQPAKEALKGIDLAVPRGSIFALLGPNGAGKSTFINILAGLVLKTSGSASIWGFDTDVNPRQARASIGVVPQELNIDPFFTPAEVMEMQAGLYGVPKRERRTMEILKAMGLDDKADAYARTLSGGMRRRLLVAKAMVHNPPVLIMDEPTDGLDPNQKFEVRKLIGRMAAEKAIVISTHILEEVDAICTRALIIDRGRVVADGTPGALMARSRYHNAVSLTLGGQTTVAVADRLRNIPGIASIEVTPRGEETTFTLFPEHARESDTLLVDAVARIAREENWPVRALYGEPGRLDEVFRNLTRSDTASSSGATGKDAA